MINEKIVNVLAEFINKDEIKYLTYTGQADTYCVFNLADDKGINFADDEPEDIESSIQVHIFTKKPAEYKKLRNSVREALFKAGFSYPALTELYEKETKIYHIVYECEFVEGRE